MKQAAKIYIFASLALLCPLLSPELSAQDTVELLDGRVYEGKVLDTSNDKVTIRAIVGRFESKITLNRADVAVITLADPDSDEDPAPVKKAARAASTGDAAVVGEGYLRVPLVGTFGTKIQADGLRGALRRARAQKGVKHIVLEVDSPGGLVSAAREISRVIVQYDDYFEFHAIVIRGLSASVWAVLSCDTITMRPAATLGAAVPYLQTDTGARAVDAKMASAMIAELRATAEQKGHPPELVDPMIDMNASVVAWRGEDSTLYLDSRRPSSVRQQAIVLNNRAGEILTLTASEAEAVGLAKNADVDARSLGRKLELENWNSAGDYGGTEMANGFAKYQRWVKKQEGLVDRLNKLFGELLERAGRINEDFQKRIKGDTFYYEPRSGKLHRSSKNKWQGAIRAAMQQCTKAREKLQSIRKQQEQMEKDNSAFDFDEEAAENVDKIFRDVRESLSPMLKWDDIREIGPYVQGVANIKPRR